LTEGIYRYPLIYLGSTTAKMTCSASHAKDMAASYGWCEY